MTVKVSEVLAAAKDRILFGGWTQGTLYRFKGNRFATVDGVDEVPAEFIEGDEFCASGAIASAVRMAYPGQSMMTKFNAVGFSLPEQFQSNACKLLRKTENVLNLAITNHTQSGWSVPGYNDGGAGTVDDILARFDEAIALAKEDEDGGHTI